MPSKFNVYATWQRRVTRSPLHRTGCILRHVSEIVRAFRWRDEDKVKQVTVDAYHLFSTPVVYCFSSQLRVACSFTSVRTLKNLFLNKLNELVSIKFTQYTVYTFINGIDYFVCVWECTYRNVATIFFLLVKKCTIWGSRTRRSCKTICLFSGALNVYLSWPLSSLLAVMGTD